MTTDLDGLQQRAGSLHAPTAYYDRVTAARNACAAVERHGRAAVLVHDSARATRLRAQLRPDLTAGEAAALCTGPMERVAAGDLAEARTWLRYANAAYFLEAEARRSRWHPQGPAPCD
jgi:2-C-methyl-D-erythritol 4-phosphate cytidylyltransferase